MTNLELLHLLKAEAAALNTAGAPVTPDSRPKLPPDERLGYLASQVAEYNRQALLEMRDRDCVDVIADIDLEVFNEFTLLLTQYLADNAPGQETLHKYVRLTATYLTFIARKPLHPPGLIFADGQRLTAHGNTFFCPVKSRQLSGAPSVCKYCVSRESGEMQSEK